MARGTDTGNFVMLILGAGAAGVFFGDWAGKAVLWIGIIAMGVGAVVYILESWGIDLSSPPQGAKKTVAPPEQVRAPLPSELPKLTSAVASRDWRQVEHLVLSRNLSPFENTLWDGELISAHQLATRIDFKAAVDFFQDWSTRGGAEARFPLSASD